MITIRLAPPCFFPFKEDIAAAIAEYVSEPLDVTTLVVNVELLPPPCSICNIRAISKALASSFEYSPFGLSILNKFSARDRFLSGLCIYIELSFS